MAVELADVETVLERPYYRRIVRQQRPDAAADITRCRDTEQLAQASARAAVVGDRDDRRYGARVALDRLQAGCLPVAATDRHHPWPMRALESSRPRARRSRQAHLSMSRWWIEGSKPCSRTRAAISSASATERCWPPVQPMAIDR